MAKKKAKSKKCTIHVYLDDGNVFEYEVNGPDKAREHANAIVKGGYRHCTNGELVHYPPHKLEKVKAVGPSITTTYPDKVRGT